MVSIENYLIYRKGRKSPLTRNGERKKYSLKIVANFLVEERNENREIAKMSTREVKVYNSDQDLRGM